MNEIKKHYTDDENISAASQELAELIVAINKKDRGNIVEETGDVMIMLQRICDVFDISDDELDHVIEYKLNRQLDRIGVSINER